MEYQCTKVQAECNRTGCQQRDIEIKVLKSSIYIEVRNHTTGLGVSLEKEEQRSKTKPWWFSTFRSLKRAIINRKEKANLEGKRGMRNKITEVFIFYWSN